MGEADRVLGGLDGLHDGPVAGVAEVHQDAQLVHLLDEAYPEVAEAGVVPLHAAVPDLVPEVVGDLDDPYPPLVGDL